MLNPNHGICFAKIGQAAFNPAHFVPGIGPSPDQMLQGRLFFYRTISTVTGSMHLTLCLPVNQPMHRTPAAAVAGAQCAPTATRE